jgi:ABC-type transporter Mla subunit MlaD
VDRDAAPSRSLQERPTRTIAQTQSAVVLENLISQFISGRADSMATPGTAASAASR